MLDKVDWYSKKKAKLNSENSIYFVDLTTNDDTLQIKSNHKVSSRTVGSRKNTKQIYELPTLEGRNNQKFRAQKGLKYVSNSVPSKRRDPGFKMAGLKDEAVLADQDLPIDALAIGLDTREVIDQVQDTAQQNSQEKKNGLIQAQPSKSNLETGSKSNLLNDTQRISIDNRKQQDQQDRALKVQKQQSNQMQDRSQQKPQRGMKSGSKSQNHGVGKSRGLQPNQTNKSGVAQELQGSLPKAASNQKRQVDDLDLGIMDDYDNFYPKSSPRNWQQQDRSGRLKDAEAGQPNFSEQANTTQKVKAVGSDSHLDYKSQSLAEIDEKGILHSSDKRFPRKLDFGVDKQNNTLQEDYQAQKKEIKMLSEKIAMLEQTIMELQQRHVEPQTVQRNNFQGIQQPQQIQPAEKQGLPNNTTNPAQRFQGQKPHVRQLDAQPANPLKNQQNLNHLKQDQSPSPYKARLQNISNNNNNNNNQQFSYKVQQQQSNPQGQNKAAYPTRSQVKVINPVKVSPHVTKPNLYSIPPGQPSQTQIQNKQVNEHPWNSMQRLQHRSNANIRGMATLGLSEDKCGPYEVRRPGPQYPEIQYQIAMLQQYKQSMQPQNMGQDSWLKNTYPNQIQPPGQGQTPQFTKLQLQKGDPTRSFQNEQNQQSYGIQQSLGKWEARLAERRQQADPQFHNGYLQDPSSQNYFEAYESSRAQEWQKYIDYLL